MALIMRPSFEYRVLNMGGIPPEDLPLQMNVLGSQGWELVGITNITYYWFKRTTGNLTVNL